MNTENKLIVTEIQRFCMHDGPGVRTTVFLKGCPMSCAWCHNPETQKKHSELLFYPQKCILCKGCEQICKSSAHTVAEAHTLDRSKCDNCFSCTEICPSGALEICGKEMLFEDILSEIKKDIAFYGKNGGVTLSGGEPFMQGNAVIEFMRACKNEGLSVAIETCGHTGRELLTRAAEFADLFLWDIKDTDSERHMRYTGVSNRTLLENLRAANALGARIRLRCILVNGVNTVKAHYTELAKIAKEISNSDGIEIIPYHAYGGTKSVFIGNRDSGRTEWIPTDEQILEAKSILREEGIRVL